jgi:lipopolysaccharide biosynthesis glycosyltransferase
MSERKRLSTLVCKVHNNVVAYGPFKGLKLTANSFWSGSDHGGMILGLYEQEVINVLSSISPRRRVLINLGGGDGYYSVGALVADLFDTSYCFEIDEKGREVILANAELNNVANRVRILGEASKNFYEEIEISDLNNSVLLVDIEGGEYDILNREIFRVFEHCPIVVELHEWDPDAADRISQLKAAAADTHSVEEFKMGSRDLSSFSELIGFNDDDRWLLCSEGRPYMMKWLFFEPKIQTPQKNIEEITNPLPVVFCFDAGYAPYAAVATYSLFKNSCTPLKIYWIIPSKDFESAKVIRNSLTRPNLEINIITSEDDRFSSWKQHGHISKAAYLRLLIPNLLKEDRAIYIDCDTLILDDLSSLYATDLRGFAIGGVLDPVGANSSHVPRSSSDSYINSGVLLLDLKVLREDNFIEKCEEINSMYYDTIIWLDQCIINKYAEDRKLLIDSKWNTQIFAHITSEKKWQEISSEKKPYVIHFLGGCKPWQKICPTYISDFWWAYAKDLNLAELDSLFILNHNISVPDVNNG